MHFLWVFSGFPGSRTPSVTAPVFIASSLRLRRDAYSLIIIALKITPEESNEPKKFL